MQIIITHEFVDLQNVRKSTVGNHGEDQSDKFIFFHKYFI